MRPAHSLAVLLAVALLSGTASSLIAAVAHAQASESASLTVNVVKPVKREWPETVPATGWLKPWHEAIVASEISGIRITDVLVDVGSVVKKGQPLVQLAKETVLAELDKQKASVETAQADLAKARANADRARKIKGSGALSDEQVNDYLISEQTATASLKSAQADLESQRIKVDQTTIRAADDGLITSRSAQLGSVVSSGTELFRLLRQQRVEWQAEVSAQYLPRIKDGLEAVIERPDGGEVLGQIRLVAPTVSTSTGRAIVYVALPTSDHPPEGLYVSGRINLKTTAALTLPETAIVYRDGINYVFTVDDEDRVTRMRVDTGRRNGDEVEIVSGLSGPENVVKSGGAFLSDHALVRVEGDSK